MISVCILPESGHVGLTPLPPGLPASSMFFPVLSFRVLRRAGWGSRFAREISVVVSRLLLGLLATGMLSAAPENERLLNLSSRAWVGEGKEVLIAGFVIAPGPDKSVLVRAIGPTLTDFGVRGAVVDPQLSIVDAAGRTIATNQSWSAFAAEAFPEVGAFGLRANSADAALVVRLEPGAYTAVASAGGAAGFGSGLIEVYDLEGPARLTNLSTRARVEAESTLVISGLVVGAGGGPRQLLLRAIGPTLGDFGVAGALADPVMALVRQSDEVQLASNDDWEQSADGAGLSTAFAEAGAFALPAGSRDSALLVELSAGAYTVLVSGANGAAGPALVEVYDLTPTSGSAISVQASRASTDTSPGAAPAVVTVARSGAVDDALEVNLVFGGTARMGTDYVFVPRTLMIPAGTREATLEIVPYANTDVRTFNKNVVVTVDQGDGYAAGIDAEAEVTIFYSAGTLYVANLAATTATSSAYGTATVQLASDEESVVVSARFGSLTSPETTAYLRLGEPGENAAYLLRLPNGQVSNVEWDIQGVGELSADDVRTALREGRVFLSIGSANHPAGELQGTFVRYEGSRSFIAPEVPPAAPTHAASEAEAARFLTQATFGATRESIDALVGQSFESWIDQQMMRPASSHQTLTRQELAAYGEPNFAGRPDQQHRFGAWWKIAVDGEDQLRQRVAFALSEILVVSDENGEIYNWQEAAARYYDLLVNHAFGNYRDLLEDVTLSPVMGVYLSHLRNAKADSENGTVPDENFAREIMQLFSIGLVQLHPDGSLQLDGTGLPIPTYDQEVITGMAQVFTGWAFHDDDPQPWKFRWGDEDYFRRMMVYPEFHEDGAKTIVTGIELPAGQGAVKDLTDALDALFEHPNTGPFLARRLIQRLVTSNPSPGYIHRVARAFNDNGQGVRGDMGATVKAILLDYEARSPDAAARPSFGKIKEPLLRVAGMLRAFDAASANGQFRYFWSQVELSQGPLRSPSVFNFFTPDYVPVGELAAAGLFAPELQIHTDTTALSVPNRLAVYSFSGWSDEPAEENEAARLYLDFDRLIALYDTPEVILDELDLLLCSGTMGDATKARVLQAMADMPSWVDAQRGVNSLVYMVVTSPDAAVQN